MSAAEQNPDHAGEQYTSLAATVRYDTIGEFNVDSKAEY